jgi:hypothetical protein
MPVAYDCRPSPPPLSSTDGLCSSAELIGGRKWNCVRPGATRPSVDIGSASIGPPRGSCRSARTGTPKRYGRFEHLCRSVADPVGPWTSKDTRWPLIPRVIRMNYVDYKRYIPSYLLVPLMRKLDFLCRHLPLKMCPHATSVTSILDKPETAYSTCTMKAWAAVFAGVASSQRSRLVRMPLDFLSWHSHCLRCGREIPRPWLTTADRSAQTSIPRRQATIFKIAHRCLQLRLDEGLF